MTDYAAPTPTRFSAIVQEKALLLYMVVFDRMYRKTGKEVTV